MPSSHGMKPMLTVLPLPTLTSVFCTGASLSTMPGFFLIQDLTASCCLPLPASPLPQLPFGSLSFVRSYLSYAQCGDHSVTAIGSFFLYARSSSASIPGVEPSITLYFDRP